MAQSQNNDTILVRDGDHATPFSRGILMRSLTNIGMDDSEAYELSCRVQSYLHREGESLIAAEDLVRLVEGLLRSGYPDALSGRYARMCAFHRHHRPLIVLIGGSTGSGKSTLATEIAYRFRIHRIISTDAIRNVMRSMVSADLLPSIHKSSFEAWKTDPFRFSSEGDPVLVSFMEQANRVSVAVRALIDRVVQEELDMVLEGVHLVPGIIDTLPYEDVCQFIHFVLAVEDEEEHVSRFNGRGHVTQKRPGKRYIDNLDSIRSIQGYVTTVAQGRNVPVFTCNDHSLLLNQVVGYIQDRLT